MGGDVFNVAIWQVDRIGIYVQLIRKGFVVTIPKLKRVKILGADELRVWLAKNSNIGQDIMLVMFDKSSGDKHIAREVVNDALHDAGWRSGRVYTLHGNQIGHVISP
jgi:hypothetical protein